MGTASDWQQGRENHAVSAGGLEYVQRLRSPSGSPWAPFSFADPVIIAVLLAVRHTTTLRALTFLDASSLCAGGPSTLLFSEYRLVHDSAVPVDRHRGRTGVAGSTGCFGDGEHGQGGLGSRLPATRGSCRSPAPAWCAGVARRGGPRDPVPLECSGEALYAPVIENLLSCLLIR